MVLEVLPEEFTVCQPASLKDVNPEGDFYFLARTDRELSLVCPTRAVPACVRAREDGWRAFRAAGTLDFSLVGILARLTGILADRGIGLFAVSTDDTDYILVRAADLQRALAALSEAGYTLREA